MVFKTSTYKIGEQGRLAFFTYLDKMKNNNGSPQLNAGL